MKNKAQKFRSNPIQLCLVFLLLLSGTGQIWGQKKPNPKDKTSPTREQKSDELMTPGNSEKGLNSEKTNRKDDSLRAKTEAENNQNQDWQPLRERNNAEKNHPSESTQTEKRMTLVVTEDVAEYQLTDEVEVVVAPTGEKNLSTSVKITRPKSKPNFEKTTQLPGQNFPSCSWDKVTGSVRDPFDAQSKICYEALATPRDPFLKPLATVTVFGGQMQPQQFIPYWQPTPDQLRRTEAGFNPQWIDWIIAYASAEKVDPLLVLEVMRWESSFKPWIKSPVGAGGLMQFMPATAQRFGINPFDEQQAISGGSRYLGFLLRRYNGNVLSALAGYNAGEGAVDAFLNCRSLRAGKKVINPLGRCTPNGIPPYQETQKYAAGIWANYQYSVKRAEGIADMRQRIAVNVRFRIINSEVVGLNKQQTDSDRN